MKKDYSIIDKSEIMPCWKCDASGLINGQLCDVCQGTGKWKESHYIIVDEKNKIAIDSDTGS